MSTTEPTHGFQGDPDPLTTNPSSEADKARQAAVTAVVVAIVANQGAMAERLQRIAAAYRHE